MYCKIPDIFRWWRNTIGSILFVFCLSFGNSLRIFNLQSRQFAYIVKISWSFTFLKSADILHSRSQLITKSYLHMEGIVLFVKILGLRKGRQDLKFFMHLVVCRTWKPEKMFPCFYVFMYTPNFFSSIMHIKGLKIFMNLGLVV